jgi:hypothetical protein
MRHIPAPALLLTILMSASTAIGRGDEVSDLARAILDDQRPQGAREAIVRDHPELSDRLIVALTADLEVGTPEEGRRIPWIWRVAVAAGKRNDREEVRRVLRATLPPRDSAPLDDWRTVVLGGGLVNGIGLAGGWPAERIRAIVEDDPELSARWDDAIEAATLKADDEGVSTGTRYDALRLVAMQDWDSCGSQLFRYLLKGVHDELQQGAISGLSDVRSPCVSQALLSGVDHYSAGNRDFALDALLREESRVAVLLDAVEAGRLSAKELGPSRVRALRDQADSKLQQRARELLPE